MRLIALPVVAVLVFGAFGPAARAADLNDAFARITTLNIAASGEVKAEPDQAIVTFGVQTVAKSAADAMRQNAARMTAVLAAIRAAGVEARDIQTSALSLSSQYAYDQNQPPRLTGYQASNQVTVRVRALARVGAVLDSVVAAGVNQVNGVEFTIADPAPLPDEARRRAVKALAARADLYAQAEGMRVARLINLEEGGGEPRPVPMVRAAAFVSKSAAPTPVEPGELTVRVDVSAVYELLK